MIRPSDLVLTPMGVLFRGRRLPCSIGRGGIIDASRKREGDGGTPRGVHRITGMLYRPDRIANAPPWARPIRLGDLWSDDSNDADYNCPVRAPHAFSHEYLRRADPLYDLILLTDWNRPDPIAGRGSAIFLHQWRRAGHPTAGCVAFSRRDLAWVIERLTPDSRLIVR